MKAVMAEIPPHILEWRRRTGADQWDEVWEGVLHMVPPPHDDHQELEWSLETWFRIHWARPYGNKVRHQRAVAPPGDWPHNYRVPDLVLLTPDRFDIEQGTHLEGAPNVVVEIRSPEDETYEKLPFYASLGVPEVWVIDRDTKQPELHVLKSGSYEAQSPAEDGWIHSAATGIQLRGAGDGRVTLQIAGEESTR